MINPRRYRPLLLLPVVLIILVCFIQSRSLSNYVKLDSKEVKPVDSSDNMQSQSHHFYDKVKNGNNSCSNQMGWGFLHEWKNLPRQNICQDNDVGKASSVANVQTKDKIFPDEYTAFGKKLDSHSGRRASFVELHNVVVVSTEERTLINISCNGGKVNREAMDALRLPGNAYNINITFNKLSNCSHTTDSAILHYRFNGENLYHMFENTIGALETSALAGVDPSDIPVLFVDNLPKTTTETMMLSAFGNEKLNISPYSLRKVPCMHFNRLFIGLTSRSGSVVP